MSVEEGVIRESLPGQGAEEEVVDPLDWTEAETKAMSGEADAEAAETVPLRAVEEAEPETTPPDGEVEETGQALSSDLGRLA